MSSGSGPRLILDIQATQSRVHHDRGIARFVREQARLLLRRGRVAGLLLNPHLRFPLQFDQELLASPLLRWNTATELRRIVEGADDDLAYYVMSPFESSGWPTADLATHALRSDLPLVTTLYDLIPLLHPDRYLTDPAEERRYRTRTEFLERADLVLAISEHTRSDAIAHLALDPQRISTIGAGVSDFFSPADPDDDAPEALLRHALPDLRGPFVLTLTGGDRRKNTERLLDAWARVGPTVRHGRQLVISCRVEPTIRQAWADHAAAAGLEPADVVFTDWITDEVLRALYRRADLFVFPPLYEGFGLPAAEALACGCPVVTSSTSSLPEVLCWPEATFDPADTAQMAATIERGLTDESFRAELLARGATRRPELTWDAVVDRTIEAVASASPSNSRPDHGGAERPSLPVHLAVVGPMPPTWSGIADYNARLLPELAARCRVDVFTPLRRPPELADLDVGWYPVKALGDHLNPHAYDAVVYTVGNSDDHHDLYELALDFPGLLWMHDVRLPGLYVTYAQDRVPAPHGRDFLEERLRRQYRRRVPFVPGPDIAVEVTTHYIGAGLGLTRELVDTSRGVLVSSELASRLLCHDQGPDAGSVPTWVVPLGAPPTFGPRTATEGAPVVASFGLVSPVKGAEVLVRAMPAVAAAHPGARLVFVGPVDDHYRAELARLVDEVGVADRVSVTGHVAAEAYAEHLTASTLGVQLRQSTNGESSAAVLDCLAAGLPVVTNVAAAAELPEGSVDLVDHEIDAAAVATHLVALLADPDRLAALGERGRRAAASWGLGAVADRLLEVVAEVQSVAPPSGR